jgi:hypothetical protein
LEKLGMTKRLFVVGAIGGFLLLLAVFWSVRGQYAVKTATEAVENKVSPRPAKTLDEAIQNQADRKTNQAQEIHPARQAYFSGLVAREIIERGKNNPRYGGMRYARTVYINCMGFTPDRKPLSNLPAYSLLEDSALTLKRRQAHELLATRCGGLLAQDLAISKNPAFARLLDQDELIDLDLKLLAVKPGWSQEREHVLNQLFKYKDPAQLMDFGPHTTRIDGAFWFDGKKLTATEQEEMLAAWRIVPCKFGADCGPNSYVMLRACAYEGHCFAANREDWILMLAREKDASVSAERVKSFVEQLTVVIEKGDSTVFKPKT